MTELIFYFRETPGLFKNKWKRQTIFITWIFSVYFLNRALILTSQIVGITNFDHGLKCFSKKFFSIYIIILSKHTDFDKGHMATFHFYNSGSPSIYERLTSNPLLCISFSLIDTLFSINYIGFNSLHYIT